jgi:hypothetical protein
MVKGACLAAHKEILRFLESLLLKVLDEQLWHNVT